MMDEKNTGLTTKSALSQLHDDIEKVLLSYETKYNSERIFSKVISTFMNPYNSPLSWFPVLATIFCGVSLFSLRYYFSGIFVLVLLFVNVFFVVREDQFRKTEIYRKVRYILDEINLAIELCSDWTLENFPHLCSPISPCVTLQWTYREGKIINLPWALLVEGDHIVMRPGQVAPGNCKEVTGKRKFRSGETYGLSQPIEAPKKPVARIPMPDLICVLEFTPYLENLKTTLDNFLNRPISIINQQRNLLLTKSIQTWGFLFVLAATLFVGLLRYMGLYMPGKITVNVVKVFIENPTLALIPILPLMFPIIWICINLWGIARLETFLSLPQTIMQNENGSSFQEDLDTPTCDLEQVSLPRKCVLYYWLLLLKGRSNLLGRSANIVQVMGTITALCCVDKKGILSYSNPTAEKVFFLRSSSSDSKFEHSNSSSESSLDSESSHKGKTGAVAEVLDLTHDQHSPFKLEFDDHEWKNHIDSLKPLGLAILVNTCCPLTQKNYSKFCGHVTAVAMLSSDLVPSLNRRCLCELARQIGFTPQARNIFSLEGQISSYRQLLPDVVRRDIKFAKSLQIAAKVKVPFPHSLSVVMKEQHSASLQLLTQGTADIVLDCCDDYWDGHDLHPLTPQERKRAQDFYQRSVLTAYCTAFSYRPLRHGITGSLSGKCSDNDVAYLELPSESKSYRSHIDRNRLVEFDDHGDKPLTQHSISTDSLLFTENKEEDISDVDGCYELTCHQVFIGMITMQYQAQTDVVQLIERLERACIRFVHFSKENELRSRVFSEKMGLESGWNCHISLLSNCSNNLQSPKHNRTVIEENTLETVEEDNELNHLLHPMYHLESSKGLSSSAPSAISNADYPEPHHHSSHESIELQDFHGGSQRRTSRDSAMDCPIDSNGRSLSCLTDSTEQSAPINFDMSNRAKLPRGIENIRPHLENVDNVPLLVSLFTDCSAEATREMLKIMQQYGEIVVCLGSSASNSNSEIFLQGDCSIAVEPLYPQVCQDYPAYTESNIYNNKAKIVNSKKIKYFENVPEKIITISPIYLSRMLNSLSCSIAMCRDDPISLVNVIELSRRFIIGLWNCLQFWICCGCSLTVVNTIATFLALPPIFIPCHSLYLMCFVIPLIAVSLVRIEPDSLIMSRATGKKLLSNKSRIVFMCWCYVLKFLPSIMIMVTSFCFFLSHPIEVFGDDDEENGNGNVEKDLHVARSFILLGMVVHFVTISSSFVHRDYTIFNKNPFSNLCWVSSALGLLILHIIVIIIQIITDDYFWNDMDRIWPVILYLLLTSVVVFGLVELIKWEEIKANLRSMRRARLDFGTKLGMNSPF